MTDAAAPAVHVDQWKHWSFHEGKRRASRTAPEGCAVVVDGNELYLQEMSSGREFALPPRSPDAQAWFEANRDDLRGGKNWKRRRAEALATIHQPGTRSSPPWTFSFHLYTNGGGLAYSRQQRITYMASFFGVSQVSTTNNVELCIWPGIQPPDNSTVLQPVLIRRRPGPTQAWQMHSGIDHQGNEINVGEAPIHMPQGVWGVIREYPAAGYWLVGFYRGNAGNAGPGFNRPFPGMIPLHVLFKDPRWAVDLTTMYFNNAAVDIEIPDADGATGWNCSDINIQAVWGGLTLQSGPNRLPVQWLPATNLAAQNGCTCSFIQPPIQNPTSNGSTMITAGYGDP